jgi:anti-sigma B factor antagonist
LSEQYGLEVGERNADGIHLRVSGEVDLEVAPLVLDSILAAGLACEPGDPVVLDLRGVTFIDSSGLAMLVEAHRRIARQGKVLRLGELSARVQRLVSLTGLDQLFGVEAATAQQERAS